MRRIILFAISLLAMGACSTKQLKIELENTLPVQRMDEGIRLNREQFTGNTRFPENKVPAAYSQNNTPLASQVIDLDNDGLWDELFILCNFDSLETKKVTIKFIKPEKYPEQEYRTNIRFGDKMNNYTELSTALRLKHAVNTETARMFQMEGPGWENDHVGFRNYFDRRNGMDIFGKTTHKMILDSAGIEGFPGYHDLSWWGMDILKVDKSLGAGSIAIDLNDSLYRVGDNGTGTFSQLYEGPLTSAFLLEFPKWRAGNDSIYIEQTISIQAGSWYYESSVLMQKCEKPVLLVTGIVNKKSKTIHSVKLNDDYTAFYTFDHQAEDSTLLTMALLVSNQDIVNNGETPDSGDGITETYFIRLKISNDEPVVYRFYSFWEREDKKWMNSAMIEEKLRGDARCFSAPIVVRPID